MAEHTINRTYVKMMATKKKGQEAAKDKSKKQGLESVAAKRQDKEPKVSAKAQRKDSDKDSTNKGKRQDERLAVVCFIEDAHQFLREVAIEFRKISWPARQQVIQETYSVLFLVTVITLMVLGFDWILGHGVFGPIEHWARLHGGGVGHS